jgi:membrane-associated protease RseP (regulator of RpoE activity)
MNFFLLLLLGLATYIIVQRTVANITKTPVWILWLVMMTPAFLWSAWFWIYGENRQMPPLLLFGPFILCPILYWWLIQIGRTPPEPEAAKDASEPVSPHNNKPEPEKSTVRPLTQAEEATLRHCFPWSIYYLHNLEYRPQAVICRGTLRGNPEIVYKSIQENIESKFGDRFLILLQEDLSGKPFFALVPNPHAQVEGKQQQEKATQPGLALGLFAATLFTTTMAGAKLAGVTEAAIQSNPGVLLQGLPYAIALMAILGIHELGHYLTARFYKISATLPYFMPFPLFPGTFGAFIQMRRLVPNRKVLFDVGIAGPIAGFIVTLPILIWGLANSQVVAQTDKSSLFNMDSLDPSFSFLLSLLTKLVLGNNITAAGAIDMHPVAVAGCLGLILTAFNLMPVGQLDGGHIVHAMFGQRSAIAIGQITRFLLLGLWLVHRDLWLWVLILFLLPITDEPALNDITDLDNQRDFLGLVAMVLLVAIVLPVPRFLGVWLGV